MATTQGSDAILPNMPSTRVGATIDVRLDYTAFDSLGDVTLVGLTLHGQYIWPQNYGAYVSLPYYYADGDGDSEKGIGNIEVGGLYKVPQGATSEILLRGGIAIHTAGASGSAFAPFSQLGSRPYDAFTTGFSSSWLKLEGSYRHSAGNMHLGLSGGADVPFAGDDDDEDGFNLSPDFDAIVKAAASISFQSPGSVGFGLGLSMLYLVGFDEDDSNPIFNFNATVSLPVSPKMSLYGAFGLPDLETNIDEFDVFAIGVGLRATVN